jgi:hypothetical protein
MQVTTGRKRWFAILGSWPLVYAIGFVAILNRIDVKGVVGPTPPATLPPWFMGLIALHVGTILVGYAVLIGCLVYLVRRSDFNVGRKVMWFAALVLGNIITMPLFIIWQMRSEDDARHPQNAGLRGAGGAA